MACPKSSSAAAAALRAPARKTISPLVRSSSATYQRPPFSLARSSARSTEPLGDAACAAQDVRQFAEELIVARMERGLGDLIERRAQHVQSPNRVATLDQENALEATTVRMPKGQSMPLGILEQHRDEGLRRVEIAGEQGHRA